MVTEIGTNDLNSLQTKLNHALVVNTTDSCCFLLPMSTTFIYTDTHIVHTNIQYIHTYMQVYP